MFDSKKILVSIQNALNRKEDILRKARTIFRDSTQLEFIKHRFDTINQLFQLANTTTRFSICFLGTSQNGKSTLINCLIGKKVLPEGHVGACSAAIVRCRYKKQDHIALTFNYISEEQFNEELKNRIQDAKDSLSEESDIHDQKEKVSNFLSRFIRLFNIEVSRISDPKKIIELCSSDQSNFKERRLLGTTIEVGASDDTEINENLSARGRKAFIVNECIIEGDFSNWHPAMELVDMPGTNAFDPWHSEVTARNQTKIDGLVLLTKETQLYSDVLDWFKESNILYDIAGSSQRFQTRVFLIKTFVDRLELDDSDDQTDRWELTKKLCQEIEVYLRKQITEVIERRFSAPNEQEHLYQFVNTIPIHFVSAKIFRNLSDDGRRNRVLNNPMNNMELFEGFQRFNKDAMNTGIPKLKADLFQKTEEYVQNEKYKKLALDFQKEVDQMVDFFRKERVEIESGLAQKSEYIQKIKSDVAPIFQKEIHLKKSSIEGEFNELKDHFQREVESLLTQISQNYGKETRSKLTSWKQIHWASLRCAGRKRGQHITSKGITIDFNSDLAISAIKTLNTVWIDYRDQMGRQFFEKLQIDCIPSLKGITREAMGKYESEKGWIENTYGNAIVNAQQSLEIQKESYFKNIKEFDSLLNTLSEEIRSYLIPTYEKIARESGTGCSARMRDHLEDGVHKLNLDIKQLVQKGVKNNCEGITISLEKSIADFFKEIENELQKQDKESNTAFSSGIQNKQDLIVPLKEMEENIRQLLPSL